MTSIACYTTNMIIKGFQRTSLVDFPGNIVSTVFLAGCNFRCHFCHNPELVFDDVSLKRIPEETVMDELSGRKRFIDGVCVTGGEPTIHDDLPYFLENIKAMGFKVKLDTNGTNPRMLKRLIDCGVVDYVAMDIKSSIEGYPGCVNANVDTRSILKSIDILRNSGIDYEFRTTVVPGLFDLSVLKSICGSILGAKNYFLQQFSSGIKLVNPEYSDAEPFSEEQLGEFAAFARKFVQNCGIRNV